MFASIIQKFVRKRSELVANRVIPFLEKSNTIIDIGSGTGDVDIMLQSSGFNITPVDVADFHGVRLLKTTLYDGKTLPFADRTFDTALLLMVMHHTPDPEIILAEASRVANTLVVIETSFITPLGKLLTVILDAIGNLRLEAFWSSYKTDSEWRDIFSKHGFIVSSSHRYQDKVLGFPFLHISYQLKQALSADPKLSR